MELEKLLCDLVSIPSVSSNESECRRIIQYVRDLFKKLPYSVRSFERNGVESVLISPSEQLEFDLLFLGHLDVVPAPGSITPSIRAGKVYGRGSADMKGPVAAMLSLFIEESDKFSSKSVGLLLTTDEEVGGFDGVSYLLELGLRSVAVFNPDGPDGGYPFQPCIAEKGVLHIKLSAQGTSAHGAHPWLGVNAIDLIVDDIMQVRSLYQWGDMSRPNDISMNVGKIYGGTATNLVPSSCSSFIDIRFPHPLTVNQVEKMIRELKLNSEVEVLLKREPMATNLEGRGYHALIEALKESNIDVKPVKENGASDLGWFVPYGSELLMMLPKCSNFHVDDEWVDIASLHQFKQVLSLFAQKYLKIT